MYERILLLNPQSLSDTGCDILAPLAITESTMEPTLARPKTTPKDFFLYLGAMVTLYWSAGALLALLFTIIDTSLRDALTYYADPYSSGIRFAIASLLVVFPISLYLFRAIKRDIAKDTGKLHLSVRKWLYSLTIFVTAVTLIIDLITILNSFLGGELTLSFVLKVLAVFVVAGLTFWYSLTELRMTPEGGVSVRKEFMYGVPALVLLAIVYGFIVMGSPSRIRSLRFDSDRVSALQTIQWQLVNYWQQKGKLATTLADLEDPISGFKVPLDPKTKASYEFILGAKNAFQLCATFDHESSGFTASQMYTKPYGAEQDNWVHKAGRVCFDRTIDPELYPVRQKGL